MEKQIGTTHWPHGWCKTKADFSGIAPCIDSGISMQHTMGIEVEKMDKVIVDMRGRNTDNPSDRTAGIELEQRLEPNSKGVSNTITSVQKDNLVLETVAADALRMVRTEEGKRLRKDYESGRIMVGFNEFREPEPRKDEVSNTLSTVQKDNLILEQKKIRIRQATKDGFIECELPGVADLEYPSSQTRRGRVIEWGQISPTLQTESIPSVIELGNPDFYNFLYEIDGGVYLIRIRKLMPLECWRLMGFSDDDFHKAESVNSNTQLYKEAGNSIVKNCLTAIFGQMLPGKEQRYLTP